MDLHIGTSGFSFPGWRAQVYPHTLKNSQMFDYYCQHLGFDSVELNSTFYTQPNPRSLAALAQKSPANFRFMAKIHNTFTHNPHLATPRSAETFRRGLAPLIDAGKFTGLLAQFPCAFQPSRKSCDRLKYLRDAFAPYPLYIEFRHRLWNNPAVFHFLRHENLGYCITDLPDLPPLPSFTPVITNHTAYIRMHGRNPQWYKPATSRFDYSYADKELRSLRSSINRFQEVAYQAFVFFNNCHAGKAVRAALRLRQLAAQNTPLPI